MDFAIDMGGDDLETSRYGLLLIKRGLQAWYMKFAFIWYKGSEAMAKQTA